MGKLVNKLAKAGSGVYKFKETIIHL